MSLHVANYLQKGLLPTWSKLSGKYRSELSVHGMDFKELLSALQKYIRRSEVEKAIWVAIELSFFANAEDRGKGLRTNFLHRLMIIALEDTGPPILTIWPKLNELFSKLLSKPKTREELKLIIQIVRMLASTPHSREFSHQRTFWEASPELEIWIESQFPEKFKLLTERQMNVKANTPLPILQPIEVQVKNEATQLFAALERRSPVAFYFSINILTKLGSTAGKHFGNKSKSEFFILALLEDFSQKQNRRDVLEIIPIAVKWFSELSNLKEKFLTWYMIIQALLSNRVDSKDVSDANVDVEEWLSKNLDNKPIILDDYVIDMHTRRGKQKGKNRIDFALEGALVKNEWKGTDQNLKQIYIDNKFIQEIGWEKFLEERGFEEEEVSEGSEESGEVLEGSEESGEVSEESGEVLEGSEGSEEVSEESEEGSVNFESERGRFKLQVRVQLICRNIGQDTYFATDRSTGEKVFVKGPYLSKEDAERPIRISKLKAYFKEIDAIRMRKLMLTPDQWNNIPLGARNKCLPDKKYSFLVAEDLNFGDYPIRVHSSKLWPDTEVVDWSKVKGVTNPDSKLVSNDVKAFENWIFNMLFRYIVGIPDVAVRNFLYIPNSHGILGVDEEDYNKPAKLRSGVKKIIADQMQNYLRSHFNRMVIIMKDWLESLKQNREEIEKLLRIDISKMIERCNLVSTLDGSLSVLD